MAIDKINIKYNNPVMDQENIEKIADKVNEIIDTPAGTEVVANPTGTATQLIDKIKIDTTIYDFPPKVSAESGETTDLTLKQLAIGNNVYNVPQGIKLYVHNLRVGLQCSQLGISQTKYSEAQVILPTEDAYNDVEVLASDIIKYYDNNNSYGKLPICIPFRRMVGSETHDYLLYKLVFKTTTSYEVDYTDRSEYVYDTNNSTVTSLSIVYDNVEELN